jgi:hypothetical protein
MKGILSAWRKLFGLGLPADFVDRRKMLANNVNRALAGLQGKAFGQVFALPPIKGGAFFSVRSLHVLNEETEVQNVGL